MSTPSPTMTDPPLERIEALFQAAADLAVEERGAWLERECGEDVGLRERVAAMLARLERDESLAPPPLPAAPAGEGPGSVIGRYKLLQQIGEGGFGVVYMAEQTAPVVRKVALKVIKLGMDTREVVARFEAERQALAMMDHPNIARVLDGGETAAGRPFFVMELVRGISITEYADQNKLSTPERLALFTRTCQAVQHAHQKGVIHRDIKPSNVMVTLHDGKPCPKVIDFGVAKAMHTKLTEKTLFTEYQRFIGTPAYMSPEQAELSALDVDTRTDIYSLGVLLYELLTGTTPFDPKELFSRGLGEVQRVIREVEPQRPSARISTSGDLAVARHRREDLPGLCKLLRGDLDWIVMKALEKDRGRRYGTASELAADVERHLANEPVEAGPPRASYRLRKFLARNRAAVTATTLVLLALLIGIVGTILGMVEAGQQRDDAVAAREDAERLLGFVIETLALTDPEVALDPQASIQTLLASVASRIERVFPDQPQAEARLRATVGRAYLSLGQHRLAAPQLRRAAELFEELAENREVDGALHHETLWSLTNVLFRIEAPDAFAAAMRRQELGHALVRRDHPELADALDRFAYAVGEAALDTEHAQMEAVLELLRDCARLSESELAPGEVAWQVLAVTYMSAAYNLWYTVHEADSVPILEETLAIQRRELPANHPDTGETVTQLVGVLNRLGRPLEAEQRVRDSIEFLRGVFGDDSYHVGFARSLLGANLAEQGRFDEAEPLLLAGHAKIVATVQDPTNFYIVDSHRRLARLYEVWGREERARPHRDAIAWASANGWIVAPWTVSDMAFGPEYAELAAAVQRINGLCGTIGYSARPGSLRAEELEQPLAELYAAMDAAALGEAREVLLARYLMGWTNALVPEDRGGEVQCDMARRALPALERNAETLPYDLAEAHALIALFSYRRGQREQAYEHARAAFRLLSESAPRDSWWNTVSRVRVARCFLDLQWFEEAESTLLPAAEVVADQLGERHTDTLETRRLIVALYTAWGRPEEAAKYAPGRVGG